MRIAVIGNSAAAISGIETFRKYDQESSIVLISREKHPPYSRTLLPYFLLGRIGLNEMRYRPSHFYDQMNVEAFLGRSIVSIDIHQKRVRLDDGETTPFDKLLISSGSSPIKPKIPGLDDEGIGHLWTLDDAVRINKVFTDKKRLLIIGAGFISLMLAWVALQSGMRVTVIELLPHVMPNIVDKKTARLLETEIRKTGMRVLTETVIERIERRSKGHYTVYPANRPSFQVDTVIVAAGVKPNVDFVDADRIHVDTGILVDDRMETSVPGIYAAGDVAQGPVVSTGSRRVHALWTTAVEHGKIAGANMAGEAVHYQGSLNAHVCEFFNTTVASIGIVEESTDIVTKEYSDSERKLYLKVFLDGDLPVGGIMLGSPEDVGAFGVLRSYIVQKKPLPGVKRLFDDSTGDPWPPAFIPWYDRLCVSV